MFALCLQLEKLTETRLLELMPETIRRRYQAVKASPSATQVAEAEADLSHWLQTMSKDQQQPRRSDGDGDSMADKTMGLLRSLSRVQCEKVEKAARDQQVHSLSALQREHKAGKCVCVCVCVRVCVYVCVCAA
ncbi:hypothetical protein EON64_18940 [archaeon]|nr:MAG: hypothetical protein EON64_18940 [archaeon]